MGDHVGVDIAKASFDAVHHEKGEYRSFENNEQGIENCITWLLEIKPSLVLMESTGGYEIPLATELWSNSIPVLTINPRRIRDFAKSLGQMAKTDKIDAAMIARYAATFQPAPQDMADQVTQEIKSLAGRRRQLVEMRTQEKNRREHARRKGIAKSIAATIAFLDKEIAKIDAQIRNEIDGDPGLKAKSKLLQSMPGIGKQTAMLLLCQMPELGACSRREIASLVGLAPINRDSGMYRGKRMIGGGRKHVRHLLYMPTLVAIRRNALIRAYYLRLLQAGKEKMVAVTACTRKILTILNAMVKNQTAWNQNVA
jgi:transposase